MNISPEDAAALIAVTDKTLSAMSEEAFASRLEVYASAVLASSYVKSSRPPASHVAKRFNGLRTRSYKLYQQIANSAVVDDATLRRIQQLAHDFHASRARIRLRKIPFNDLPERLSGLNDATTLTPDELSTIRTFLKGAFDENGFSHRNYPPTSL